MAYDPIDYTTPADDLPTGAAKINAMFSELYGKTGAATTSASGIVELATNAETVTGTDTVRATTPAGVKAAIDALIAAAPGALDTLDELAAALGDDANFAATVTTALAGKQPLDADLTAIAALVSAANKIAVATGAGTWTLLDFSQAIATWTPVLTFATPGNLSVGYAQQTGWVLKIGTLRIAQFSIVTNSFSHTTAAGNLNVTGLSEASASGYVLVGTCAWAGITKAGYTHVAPVLVASSSTIRFDAFGSGQALATVAFGDVPTGGTVVLRGLIAYTV